MKTSTNRLMEKVQVFGLIAVVTAVAVMVITGMDQHFFASFVAAAPRTILMIKIHP